MRPRQGVAQELLLTNYPGGVVTERGIKDTVREKYGEAAQRVRQGKQAECCASSCCGGSADPISSTASAASAIVH